MGLLDFLKTAKDLLTGNEIYEENSSYHQRNHVCDSQYVADESECDNDEEDTDETNRAIDEADITRFEDALRRFYSRLSQKEMKDEDLDKMTNEVQDKFFEGKIKNPSMALDATYRQWKQSNIVEQRANDRNVIIDMLSRYDKLSEEEKASLVDWDSKFCLRRLKKKDSKGIHQIIQSWYDNRNLDERKHECIDMLCNSDAEGWGAGPESIDEFTPLTEKEYQFRILYFTHNHDVYQGSDYGEYFKRYWLKSGNKPQPVESDELIVNRPCYFIDTLRLATPHFHMSKRYFEKDCYQDAKVYLFADNLEMIVDVGHQVIFLRDIIDININDWSPETPEPYLLEITCRNQGKYLITCNKLVNLLVLRALMFYFIKNPQ